MTQVVLMRDQGTTGLGKTVPAVDSSNPSGRRSIQVGVAGTGAVSATVKIYGCNDGRFLVNVMTITVSGTNSATDAAQDDFPWEYYVAEVTAVSGTGALVSVTASM